MEMAEGWEEWCWYLVVDFQGNVLEAFNSLEGAFNWKEEVNGGIGIIKKVTEVTAR